MTEQDEKPYVYNDELNKHKFKEPPQYSEEQLRQWELRAERSREREAKNRWCLSTFRNIDIAVKKQLPDNTLAQILSIDFVRTKIDGESIEGFSSFRLGVTTLDVDLSGTNKFPFRCSFYIVDCNDIKLTI